MLHLTSENDLQKTLIFKAMNHIGVICAGIALISLLTYTVFFVRDTKTVEQCLAYPYANAAQLEKVDHQTAADNHCVAYLSTQNADGIQEMYLLKNKRWLNCLDVQRYIVLQHDASVMEKVGFFSTLTPSAFQENPIDWYFYSQNDLRIAHMICTFNTNAGTQTIQQFTCDPGKPFVCCIPAVQGEQQLESMVGYNQNGEIVYSFNTGLFESA